MSRAAEEPSRTRTSARLPSLGAASDRSGPTFYTRTSGLHLMCAASKQFVNFLRLHILAQPCIFPSWLWWRNRGSTVLNGVLLGFGRRSSALFGFEDARKERHVCARVVEVISPGLLAEHLQALTLVNLFVGCLFINCRGQGEDGGIESNYPTRRQFDVCSVKSESSEREGIPAKAGKLGELQ